MITNPVVRADHSNQLRDRPGPDHSEGARIGAWGTVPDRPRLGASPGTFFSRSGAGLVQFKVPPVIPGIAPPPPPPSATTSRARPPPTSALWITTRPSRSARRRIYPRRELRLARTAVRPSGPADGPCTSPPRRRPNPRVATPSADRERARCRAGRALPALLRVDGGSMGRTRPCGLPSR